MSVTTTHVIIDGTGSKIAICRSSKRIPIQKVLHNVIYGGTILRLRRSTLKRSTHAHNRTTLQSTRMSNRPHMHLHNIKIYRLNLLKILIGVECSVYMYMMCIYCVFLEEKT